MRSRFLFVLALACLSLAPLAHAQDANLAAGFPPGSLWLSTSAPVAGTAVHIYTVVYNSSPAALEGSVAFTVDGAIVGSTAFSLEAGQASVKSVDWTATEGPHTINANVASAVDKSSKQPRALGNATAASLPVSVAPAPPKPAALQAFDSVSVAAAASAPVVASASKGVVATTEAVRQAGQAYLESKANPAADPSALAVAVPSASSASSSSSSANAGEVLGAETYNGEAAAQAAAARSGNTGGFTQAAARILLPIFKYPALFYPVLLAIALFLLWLLARRMRHPKKK